MRRLLVAAGAFLALAGAGVAAVWMYEQRETRDVVGSSTQEFVATDEPGVTEEPVDTVVTTATDAMPGTTAAEPERPRVVWPTYGYDVRRTRFAPDFDLRPPFRQIWMVRGRSLIEFPPVVAYGKLYVGTNRGRFLAIEADTGEIAWEKDLGRCTAASATVGDGVVYQPLMDPAPCAKHDQNAPGFLVAFDAETGRELWRFKDGVIESSPLLVDGVLYVGSWDKKVYALDARTGEVRWSFATGDKVKGGPAYAKGTIYIGSYDGKVYALDAASGELRWANEGQAGILGEGNFYATPAVAYGRVFIGSTDGKVYAFGAQSGDLIWSHGTGNWVYSSAAVWEETVYVGSYDRRLYALDARTGNERWSFQANGPISGSPTVLAGVVYFSTLEKRTYALDARTGKQLWSFPDGQYTPVVTDGERLYLTGHARIYGLEPR